MNRTDAWHWKCEVSRSTTSKLEKNAEIDNKWNAKFFRPENLWCLFFKTVLLLAPLARVIFGFLIFFSAGSDIRLPFFMINRTETRKLFSFFFHSNADTAVAGMWAHALLCENAGTNHYTANFLCVFVIFFSCRKSHFLNSFRSTFQ